MQLGFSFGVFRHLSVNQFTIGIGKQGCPAILTELHGKSFHGCLVVRNTQFTQQIENLGQLPVPSFNRKGTFQLCRPCHRIEIFRSVNRPDDTVHDLVAALLIETDPIFFYLNAIEILAETTDNRTQVLRLGIQGIGQIMYRCPYA